VKAESIGNVTPNIFKIVTSEPAAFYFESEKAKEIATDKKGWSTEKIPFRVATLPENKSLEFNISTYPETEEFTHELPELKKDDKLMLQNVVGERTSKGEGVFVAGGNGITPFISIRRHVQRKSQVEDRRLISTSQTKSDPFLEREIDTSLVNTFITILFDEQTEGSAFEQIVEKFMKENITNLNQQFYLCGPPSIIAEIGDMLINLGVERNLIGQKIG